MEGVEDEGPRRSCHDQALRLLAARAHFRGELAAKLKARRYDAEEIAATLERLADRGWLDDAAAARSFVAQRQRQGLGKARLRAELQKRGAPADVIDDALAGVAEDDELARAREAAARWRRGSRPAGPAGKAALARHLDRRGFARGTVMAVVAEGRASASDVELEGADSADVDD